MQMMTSRRELLASLAGIFSGAFLQDDSGRVRRWLEAIYNTEPAEPSPFKPNPADWSEKNITAAWIGHSTVLLDFEGTMILTDPFFSDRAGPDIMGLFTLGPKRLVAPALTVAELPAVQLILISHVHMDHCDMETLRLLPKDTPLVLPRDTYDVISDLGFRTVYELDRGEWTDIGGVRVEALPVKHGGGRYPWNSTGNDDGESSNAYLLSRNGRRIVFAGDTAYTESFSELTKEGEKVLLAVMPIGGYIPHREEHCTPEEALAMADQMSARFILPVHWGTLPGEEPVSEPIERLRSALGDRQERLVLDQIGQTWVFTPDVL